MKKIFFKVKCMILEIEQEILAQFKENNIKVFFYTSGCEGTKINFTTDFEKKDGEHISLYGKNIYFESVDKEKLNGAKILKKGNTNSGHTDNNTYLFISPKVQSRCGCATSFSFEKKIIDKNKLKTLQSIFKK